MSRCNNLARFAHNLLFIFAISIITVSLMNGSPYADVPESMKRTKMGTKDQIRQDRGREEQFVKKGRLIEELREMTKRLSDNLREKVQKGLESLPVIQPEKKPPIKESETVEKPKPTRVFWPGLPFMPRFIGPSPVQSEDASTAIEKNSH